MSEGSSAVALILGGDAALYAIVRLSLIVSLSATALAALFGLPFGALLALVRFRGRTLIVVLLNAFMGLPPWSSDSRSFSCCRARVRWVASGSCSRPRR